MSRSQVLVTYGSIGVSFPKFILFRKYDSFFYISNQNIFHFHGIFLHVIIAFNIAFPMNPSTSMSAENWEAEQLHAFIDETTVEVAEARNKLSHQEDLVDAFNGDATAMGYATAIAKTDKFEARLVVARARHETA